MWKDQERYSEQGWYTTLEGFDGLMGARNTVASISPLHSEVETLIWAMENMRNLRQFYITFAIDLPVSSSYIEDIKILKKSFHSWELINIPRTHNSKTDSLAGSARKQPPFIVNMDTELS